MNRGFKIIAAIADVHIGNRSISHKEYKYQLKHGIIEKLKNIAYLDGIVLCGDTLHYQISMNSEYADVFQWFIAALIKIAKSHGAFVRVIKGTKSHDLDQLNTIAHYEYDFGVDFKIINDFMIEEIDGHKYAYIAENYIKEDTDEYYKEIFDKPRDYFDMIFMHGTIEPCQFTTQNSENLDSSAPIFKLSQFYNVCRGPILAGHIHTPMNFNDKFFYVGSALRTCHGEEEDKGWNIVSYIQEEGCYRVDKVVNEYTFNFATLKLSNNFIETNTVDEIASYVDNYIKDHKVDKLSLKVTCIDKEDTTVKIGMLKKYFSKNTDITLGFKVLSEKSYEQETVGTERREKKPYLQDGLDIVERIRLWALIERNTRISEDEIRKYISAKTLERKGIK